MSLLTNQFFIGFCINFILISLFCSIPLMTKDGWISAGILGTILWGCLSWQGWMSVVIYLLLGSLVTKIGYKFKKERSDFINFMENQELLEEKLLQGAEKARKIASKVLKRIRKNIGY